MDRFGSVRAERSGGRSARGGRRQRRWMVNIAALTVFVGTAMTIPSGAGAAALKRPDRVENEFHQTNLVSNLTTVGAQVVDPNLKNPWGLAAGPTSPLWVADNNGNVATVYPGGVNGAPITGPALTVAIPGDAPTGQVFNPTPRFEVLSGGKKTPAAFIFSSESGKLTAWAKSDGPAAAHVVFSSRTAVYKGLALWHGYHRAYLYATNFHDGTIDVFNSAFHKVRLRGGFRDRRIPMGYAPFGIQQIHGLLYVSYAKQDADRHDDLKGAGHGFIDVFTPGGQLVCRLASRGRLDSPWGMAVAPRSFGPFAGDLLVGNFGDGRINVFSRFSGRSRGPLRDESGHAISVDGLWGLIVGNAVTGGPQSVLFSAGLNGEEDGLLGALNAAR